MRCANPECRMESAYLRSGTLHWIEEQRVDAGEKRGRFIWLCSICAPKFVVQSWRPPGQQLQPLAVQQPAIGAARIPPQSADARFTSKSQIRSRRPQ